MSLILGVAVVIGNTISSWLPARSAALIAASMAQHADRPGGGTDGPPGNASAVDRTLRIEAQDMSFNPNEIQVRPGETVPLEISNLGRLRHEFVIASHAEHLEHRATMLQKPDMDMASELNAVTVDPGQTKELIWKFGKEPNVEFSCDIPGHAEAGMTGAFRLAP